MYVHEGIKLYNNFRPIAQPGMGARNVRLFTDLKVQVEASQGRRAKLAYGRRAKVYL